MKNNKNQSSDSKKRNKPWNRWSERERTRENGEIERFANNNWNTIRTFSVIMKTKREPNPNASWASKPWPLSLSFIYFFGYFYPKIIIIIIIFPYLSFAYAVLTFLHAPHPYLKYGNFICFPKKLWNYHFVRVWAFCFLSLGRKPLDAKQGKARNGGVLEEERIHRQHQSKDKSGVEVWNCRIASA